MIDDISYVRNHAVINVILLDQAGGKQNFCVHINIGYTIYSVQGLVLEALASKEI